MADDDTDGQVAVGLECGFDRQSCAGENENDLLRRIGAGRDSVGSENGKRDALGE